mmetsp:Transcript_13153/g.25746  ORF Transcript_13153/g.25746 Transcript_13153/m.25746 type:complete len:261 (+) Transcript_13153:38-820(+)
MAGAEPLEGLLKHQDTVEGRLYDLLLVAFISFCSFTASALIARQFLPTTIAHRVPSTIHAIVVCAFSVWVLTSDHEFAFMREFQAMLRGEGPVDFVTGHSEFLETVVGITDGYFAVDFFLMIIDGELSTVYFIHHIVGGIVFSMAVVLSTCEAHVAFLLTTELSTPFLNVMLSSEAGTKTHLASAVCFAVTFMAIRVVPVPLYMYALYQTLGFFEGNTTTPIKWVSIISILIPPVLNVVWGGEIIRQAVAMLCPGKDKKS